jgi:tetratricopeptide (TPR) repeat protein
LAVDLLLAQGDRAAAARVQCKLGTVLVTVLRLDEAFRLLGDAIRSARADRLQLVLVDALRVQALLAGQQGRLPDAEAALEEGLALARSMPYPYAKARLLYVYGSFHTEHQAPEPVQAHLEAALAIWAHASISSTQHTCRPRVPDRASRTLCSILRWPNTRRSAQRRGAASAQERAIQ